MNDLVYVMYNLKLKSRKIRKTVDLSFEDMESNDGWITKEEDVIFYEDNFQVEQPLVKVVLEAILTWLEEI